MAKLPLPPPAGALREIGAPTDDLVAVQTETVLWRVHRSGGPHATAWSRLRHYGPVATGRFDPHEPPPAPDQTEGVLYLAVTPRTALAEAYQLTRLLDRHTDAPHLVGLRLARTVQLLDLSRAWPTRAGASQALNSGRRDHARAWARAIRAAFPWLDGVWYPSSMDGGSFCLALWAPAADALPAHPVLSRALADPALADRLAAAAAGLGYRLL